jgi:CRP-like cAMP-binding protein
MLKRKRTEGEGAAAGAGAADPSVGLAEVNYLELSFAKVPIFSACSTDELLTVARLCTLRDVDDGTDVVVEGDRGGEFFVILRGDAAVTRGGTAVGALGAGDFFGELALFDPAPRNATVTARGPLSLAVLAQAAFQRVLQEGPVRDNVFLGMARRLHQLDGTT